MKNAVERIKKTHIWQSGLLSGRDGKVTFEEELSSSSSYFQVRNLGALVTSVIVTTVKTCLKK